MTEKRNQPCPCGSGKRHKKCCGRREADRDISKSQTKQKKSETQPTAADFLRQGATAAGEGRLAEAEACFRQVVTLKPDYAEAHYNLGLALSDQEKLHEAESSFRRAIKLKPNYTEALNNLGLVLHDQNRFTEAEANFRRTLKLNPDHAKAHNNLGLVLIDQGKLTEAEISLRKALTLKPDYPKAHSNLSIVFQQLGKMDEAVACCRKALVIDPDYAKAYKNLAIVKKYTKADEDIATMERLYKRNDLAADDHIALGFALGKSYGDLKEYEKSINFVLEANLLKRKSYAYSIESDQVLFKKIKSTFSPDFFSSHHNPGISDKTPIFILGMPRSGTTLVEQILASHPLVYGAGELVIITNLVKDYCTSVATGQFPECLLDLDKNDFMKMGSEYIEKIRSYSGSAQHITDKLPHNFMYIGIIRLILPNAKIIHCDRNPMDNCLSIFKTDFKKSHKYAYDMTELGQYYKLYQELMAHWKKVLPGSMYTIRYEDVVADQQNQTKKLLEFCELPWDDSCIDFHKNERKVSTASVAQVRQPIYKDSVKLWKRYEKQLKPLRKEIE